MKSLSMEYFWAGRGWKSPLFKGFRFKSRIARKRKREPSHDSYEWSYDNQLINEEPILPLPKKQKGATCNHHASVVCMESRFGIRDGRRDKKFPTLSIQHAIDSVDSIKTRDTLLWLKNHGVTTEHHYPYDGDSSQNKYAKIRDLGWPLHNLGGYVYFDAKGLSEATITSLRLHTKADGPILGRFILHDDYQYFGGVELYKGFGPISINPLTGEEHSHLVTITGFGIENNEKYWTYMNSYGLDWGTQGKGKIAYSALDGFYIPYFEKD